MSACAGFSGGGGAGEGVRTVAEGEEEGEVRREQDGARARREDVGREMLEPEGDEGVVQPGRRDEEREVVRAQRGVAEGEQVGHGGA